MAGPIDWRLLEPETWLSFTIVSPVPWGRESKTWPTIGTGAPDPQKHKIYSIPRLSIGQLRDSTNFKRLCLDHIAKLRPLITTQWAIVAAVHPEHRAYSHMSDEFKAAAKSLFYSPPLRAVDLSQLDDFLVRQSTKIWLGLQTQALVDLQISLKERAPLKTLKRLYSESWRTRAEDSSISVAECKKKLASEYFKR
jgi:hypothetical protein